MKVEDDNKARELINEAKMCIGQIENIIDNLGVNISIPMIEKTIETLKVVHNSLEYQSIGSSNRFCQIAKILLMNIDTYQEISYLSNFIRKRSNFYIQEYIVGTNRESYCNITGIFSTGVSMDARNMIDGGEIIWGARYHRKELEESILYVSKIIELLHECGFIFTDSANKIKLPHEERLYDSNTTIAILAFLTIKRYFYHEIKTSDVSELSEQEKEKIWKEYCNTYGHLMVSRDKFFLFFSEMVFNFLKKLGELSSK